MNTLLKSDNQPRLTPPPDGVPEELLPHLDIPLDVHIELGRTELRIRDILALERDSVIQLPQPAGEELGIYVNNVCVGCGIVVVMEDKTGIRVTELITGI